MKLLEAHILGVKEALLTMATTTSPTGVAHEQRGGAVATSSGQKPFAWTLAAGKLVEVDTG